MNNKAKNVIGQIRIYTLIELILFAYAIGSNMQEIAGIALLHISFLFYLEATHKHSYRVPIQKYIWVVMGLIGIFLYAKLAVIGFIFASMLYVRKKQVPFSYLAPLARGFQCYFLAAGIVGFLSPLAFLALGMLAIRNFAGDLRDVVKDSAEGMRTLPVVFGIIKDYKVVHIFALFVTTLIWWQLSEISIFWLISMYAIQIATYNITPRK